MIQSFAACDMVVYYTPIKVAPLPATQHQANFNATPLPGLDLILFVSLYKIEPWRRRKILGVGQYATRFRYFEI